MNVLKELKEGETIEDKIRSFVLEMKEIVGNHVSDEIILFHLKKHLYRPSWAANSYLIDKFINNFSDFQNANINHVNKSENIIVYCKEEDVILSIHLPDDIIYLIFEFLKAEELVKMKLVCDRWRRIASDCYFWKRLYNNLYHIPISIRYSKFPIELFTQYLSQFNFTVNNNNNNNNNESFEGEEQCNKIVILLNKRNEIDQDDKKVIFCDYVIDEDHIMENQSFQLQYSFSKMIEKNRICPDCGIDKILPVIYGFPAPNIVKAAKERTIFLGGDGLLAGHSAFYGCFTCRKRFKTYPWES